MPTTPLHNIPSTPSSLIPLNSPPSSLIPIGQPTENVQKIKQITMRSLPPQNQLENTLSAPLSLIQEKPNTTESKIEQKTHKQLFPETTKEETLSRELKKHTTAASGQNLHVVDFSSMEPLTTNQVISLGIKHRKAEIIYLKNHPDANDRIIHKIVEYFPNLKEIYLSGCRKITNRSIIDLADTFRKNLKKISLDNCTRLTDEAVSTLALYCTEIEEMSLTGCEQLTELSINNVRKQCKKLKKFTLPQHLLNI